MKTPVFLIAAILMYGTLYAQILYPEKDIAFGQMAAGGGYETALVLTNRGASSYSGIMHLYKETGTVWNPTINGTAITNGSISVTLASGETKSYKITLPGGTESGFAVIQADNLISNAFLSSRYFGHSGAGTGKPELGVGQRDNYGL
jgi:hypothetical protein